MSNPYFQFKQFTIHQDRCAMKVTTDACLFGAWVAEEMKNDKLKIKNVLDVGAGTGLLSLMFAQKNPSAVIDAIEIDEETYQQAKENAEGSPFAKQLYVINSDVKSFSFSKKYDVILSNPPFYVQDIKPADEKKSIAHHESGLLFEELLRVIGDNLSSDGIFYALLPFKRNQHVKNNFLQQDLSLSKIVFVRQSTRHGYFRMMLAGRLGKSADTETSIEEISIWDDQQQYTDHFKQLLKDYYLHL